VAFVPFVLNEKVMKNEQILTKQDAQTVKNKTSCEPFLKYVFRENPTTGKKEACSLELSDKTPYDSDDFLEKLTNALKNTTGSEDPTVAEKIIHKISWGMSSNDNEKRLKDVTMLLNALKPQNEMEALLLGQFLALQDSGIDCLRSGNYSEMFYHKKEFFQLSTKLLRCANETMQALLKYRSGGKQQIQVVHVSGGQAIVANEISSDGGGYKKK